jgi:Co/Zn/Cd efflux system component
MNDHRHDHPHDHGHDHSPGHGHAHGIVDPSITTSDRGLWAIKWSFVGLAATAMLQLFVVLISGSVALLADTIHNFGDAATAIPLAIAFWFARKKPSERFTFGYGRVEDLAGVAIVLTIFASAIIAGYESIERLLHPQDISYLWAVMAASIIGFLGNEAVAVFRIRIGREINSAALIADGYHARVDGWTSLAVLFGAVGVWLGYPLADPIMGLLITAALATAAARRSAGPSVMSESGPWAASLRWYGPDRAGREFAADCSASSDRCSAGPSGRASRDVPARRHPRSAGPLRGPGGFSPSRECSAP